MRRLRNFSAAVRGSAAANSSTFCEDLLCLRRSLNDRQCNPQTPVGPKPQLHGFHRRLKHRKLHSCVALPLWYVPIPTHNVAVMPEVSRPSHRDSATRGKLRFGFVFRMVMHIERCALSAHKGMVRQCLSSNCSLDMSIRLPEKIASVYSCAMRIPSY